MDSGFLRQDENPGQSKVWPGGRMGCPQGMGGCDGV